MKCPRPLSMLSRFTLSMTLMVLAAGNFAWAEQYSESDLLLNRSFEEIFCEDAKDKALAQSLLDWSTKFGIEAGEKPETIRQRASSNIPRITFNIPRITFPRMPNQPLESQPGFYKNALGASEFVGTFSILVHLFDVGAPAGPAGMAGSVGAATGFAINQGVENKNAVRTMNAAKGLDDVQLSEKGFQEALASGSPSSLEKYLALEKQQFDSAKKTLRSATRMVEQKDKDKWFRFDGDAALTLRVQNEAKERKLAAVASDHFITRRNQVLQACMDKAMRQYLNSEQIRRFSVTEHLIKKMDRLPTSRVSGEDAAKDSSANESPAAK